MKRDAVGLTDIGLIRQNNEDSIFVQNEKIGRLLNLLIVADGVGGHKAGEIASKSSIDFFCEYIKKNEADSQYTEVFLADAVKYANEKVYFLSFDDPSLSGMGTTFSVCCTDKINLYYAHIGDSKIYVATKDEIRQITEDHTYVYEMVKANKLSPEEAKIHPNRNVITRALGMEKDCNVDFGYLPLTGDETILLCSDGLTDMVDDMLIFEIMSGEVGLLEKAESLIELAKKNGGIDNVSVVLA